MSDWKVVGTKGELADALIAIGTGGISSILEAFLGPTPTTYIIENKATGETREVTASSDDELGQRIADGDFDR